MDSHAGRVSRGKYSLSNIFWRTYIESGPPLTTTNIFCIVFGQFKFKIELQVAEMMKYIREELLALLEEKIRDPCLNLLNHENGNRIIRTIVNLISKEL